MFSVPHRKRPVLALFLSHLEGAYQQRLWKGFDGFCREADCDFVVFSSRFIPGTFGQDRIQETVYRLADKSRIDGLCVDSSAFVNETECMRFLDSAQGLTHVPIVLSSLFHDSHTSVFPDNAAGMSALLGHLYDVHAARTIAFAGGPLEVKDALLRFDAWKRFMDHKGLPNGDSLCYSGRFDSASGREAVNKFVSACDPFPDAIVFGNDEMAIGGLIELRKRGIRVPQDVLITGFDDIVLSRFQEPSLSTVAQNVEEKGWTCARLLLDAIHGYPSSGSHILPVQFVPRASCGCHASIPDSGLLLKSYRAILGMKQVAEGMGSVLSSEDLCREFSALFPSISGEPAFVCLYEEDIRYSHVVAAADGNGLSLVDAQTPRRFLSSQLVPAYFLEEDKRRTLIVQALYKDTSDFGFLVCADEGTESDVFVALRFQTSAAVHNIMLVSKTEQAGLRLSRALERAEESESRYRDFVENLPAFIMETDGDGRVRYANAYGRNVFSISHGDIEAGVSVSDLGVERNPAGNGSGYACLQLRSRSGRERTLFVKRWISDRDDGNVRWHGLEIKPIMMSLLMPDKKMLDSYYLTSRETEILFLELEGYLGKEIADRLSISLSTVKGHIGSMYRKMGVSSRDQLFTLMRERLIGKWGYESFVFSLLSWLLRD